MEERSLLLSSGSEEESGINGKYGGETQPSDGNRSSEQVTGPIDADAPQTKHAWWKREHKLQRSPSLDKVDEDTIMHDKKDDKSKRGSMSKLFGVKSYLHNFYEGHATKDPRVYEDEDFEYLLGHPRRQRCTSIWWKIFVWIGANFLIFGVIGILVGYLVPPKKMFIGKIGDHFSIVDPEAEAYDFNLYVCKLVGLVLFCIGGLTLAVALLFPSFFYHYCEEDRHESAFKVLLGNEKEARSPLEMQIPASSLISGVQPGRKEKEAVITKEGMLPYKD